MTHHRPASDPTRQRAAIGAAILASTLLVMASGAALQSDHDLVPAASNPLERSVIDAMSQLWKS